MQRRVLGLYEGVNTEMQVGPLLEEVHAMLVRACRAPLCAVNGSGCARDETTHMTPMVRAHNAQCDSRATPSGSTSRHGPFLCVNVRKM